MSIAPNTPILVGVGQVVNHWDGESAESAPSPVSLAVQACRAALQDTDAPDATAAAIDTVAVVRTNADSIRNARHPFGRCENPPATVAAALNLQPTSLVYSAVGGDQPQALVNEFAEAIFAGRSTAVMLSGAEAIATMKLATRRRMKLDWSHSVQGDMDDRGLGTSLLSDFEIANGLSFPTQTYPVFENALRARLGLGIAEHRALMSALLAPFSRVAAGNPFAQFPEARTPEFLQEISRENYEIAEPYLKWHVAQDAVNQGAALIMMSVAKARELGIAPAKWAFLHGYAKATDKLVTQRTDLSRSHAMELVLQRALDVARVKTSDISIFDLYSCFPCAVLLAAEILGLDWRETPPTTTGGLPFFGGAGNNYSMHAIASTVEKLRATPGAFGLVLANGGFLSKEAAGIYSTTPADNWRPVSSEDLQQAINATPPPLLSFESTDTVVTSYTVTYKKGAPQRGYILGESIAGRVLARARSEHRATLRALAASDPIGQTIRTEYLAGVHYFCAADRLGEAPQEGFMRRTFEHVALLRRGHILEVTLNRPDHLNALHSAAHFELHEIWDDFERDDDLWIAIITGAGERAFCSGNDLKMTAKGGDMSVPASGFAGLCARFDREKPVIAAINGVAMGGGLEIALACDLVVADERAKFALPEVKVGLFAAAGGVHRLTRQIGRKAAMDLILTGRSIGVEEAHALGVINQIAPHGSALAQARALADTLLENSPSAMRASRQALNQLDEAEGLKSAMEGNSAIFGKLSRTKDFREGVTAFVEKRKPQWTNT
jgi:acetyl-CoA C-acetyltransferase